MMLANSWCHSTW